MIYRVRNHSGGHKNKKIKHNIFNDTPPTSSHAHAVLLDCKLRALDTIKKEELLPYLFPKNRIMQEFKKQNLKNGAKCFYCGETVYTNVKRRQPNFATIDHKRPLCRGGREDVFNNYAVSCNKCNVTKGDLEAEAFNPGEKL